jgi:hypothetical protein
LTPNSARAIEQLNWLRPEFVLSVGDYGERDTIPRFQDR